MCERCSVDGHKLCSEGHCGVCVAETETEVLQRAPVRAVTPVAGWLEVGQWRIQTVRPGKVWIGIIGDGEGGEFDSALVAEAIDELYRRYF